MDKSYSTIEQEEHKRGQHLGGEEQGFTQQLKGLGLLKPAVAGEINCRPWTVGHERKGGTLEYTRNFQKENLFLDHVGDRI